MQIQIRTLIAFLVLLLFLVMQIFVIFPNPRLVSEINITNDNLSQTLLKLNLPEKIWYGRAEKINLQLIDEKSQNGLIIEEQNLSELDSKKIQNLEVDFVLTGAELTPPGISITPIVAERDITMNWRIESITNQDIIGTVWLYINTFSGGDEEEIQRELIFTKNIFINNKSVFGLKIGSTQWILSFLTILNIIYLIRSSRKIRSLKVSKNKKLL